MKLKLISCPFVSLSDPQLNASMSAVDVDPLKDRLTQRQMQTSEDDSLTDVEQARTRFMTAVKAQYQVFCCAI